MANHHHLICRYDEAHREAGLAPVDRYRVANRLRRAEALALEEGATHYRHRLVALTRPRIETDVVRLVEEDGAWLVERRGDHVPDRYQSEEEALYWLRAAGYFPLTGSLSEEELDTLGTTIGPEPFIGVGL